MDGKLLVIGGEDGSGRCLSTVLQYDLGDRSWTALPSLLTARAYCAVTVLGGDVVVMGGWGVSDVPIASVERYRRLQCWEAMPSLTGQLYASAAVVVWV